MTILFISHHICNTFEDLPCITMASEETPISKDQASNLAGSSKEAINQLVASCHCGRVKIELPSPPKIILQCHCTVCYKYGALWGYYARSEVVVTVSATDNGLGVMNYTREDPNARGDTTFVRCGHCGCMTHWWPAGYRAHTEKMGINTRMLLESEIEGIERKIYYC